MRIYHPARTLPPPDDGTWIPAQFGFSETEVRVATYAGIVLLLGLFAAGLYWGGPEALADLDGLFKAFGKVGAISLIVLALLTYIVVHEGMHLLAFPDRGRSDASLVGVLPWAAFVLYNGPITPWQLQRVVRRPLLLLTPPLLLWCFWAPGALSVAALVTHLLTCLGDVMMHRKLARLDGVETIWTTGREVWFRHMSDGVSAK